MKKCRSLIYAFSDSSSNSKWMPWELGYFDGIKGNVAILPVVQGVKDDFIGEEYLGIYFYIKFDVILGSNTQAIWVHETQTKYMIFNEWLKGIKPVQR